ncbi:MAG TPA: class I SAM-dependent methyltransferase [Nocardioides sp.]|jgi:SAM-dependent methyltransferase|nr:class I SAM-dependent methyltransferase [Nocardioides sp.]
MSSLLTSGAVGRRSRDALIHARGRMIFAVPDRWRGRVAAALPARLVPPEMRPGFFDDFFDEGDPFGFDRHPEEKLKFDRTLEVCGEGPLGRVLELGCAVGTFTEVLAPRAEDVLALDVSQAAVDQVLERTRAFSNVRAVAMSIPREFPDGTFDLVVASDVLYYLPVVELQRCVDRIEASLAPGGAFVAVHYVPRMGSVLNGDEAHDVVVAHTGLEHVLSERTEFGSGRPYRVDRFEKA